MPTAIFIVILSRDKWWIDLDGQSQGPYLMRESAMAEAIRIASDMARAGRATEVQIVEPGQRNKIIYQSPAQSALSRAAALVNH